MEQLVHEQWVTEGAKVKQPRGRRPTLLSLNTNRLLATVDIRPSLASVAIIDLNGRLYTRQSLPIGKDPARGVDSIAAALRGLIASVPPGSVEGIGVSLPGRVDPATDRLIFSPNLPWSTLDLKRALEAQIPLRVEMDNAANACMLSELWFGSMDGVRNAVLVTISEGIGTAILADGHLLTGARGLAGEFGHTTLIRDGLRCGCGRLGCWEMYASSRAALRFYNEAPKTTPCPGIVELLTLAADSHKPALEALTTQAHYLAEGLQTIITGLAPEVILLTGGLTMLWERFAAVIDADLKKSSLTGTVPRLIAAADSDVARLRGAAALVLQRHIRAPQS